MRSWIYQMIFGIPDLGVEVYSSAASGMFGDAPKKPFIEIRSMTQQPGLLPSFPVEQNRFQVWFHDDKPNMDSIDGLVDRVVNTLPAEPPVWFGDWWIMSCSWENTSGDSYDDHYRTTVRFAEFLVTGREHKQQA